MLACSLAACRRAAESESQPRAPAQRIVALTCYATDILAALGALDRVVAVEEDCPALGTEGKFKIRNDDRAGKSKILNIEAILALQPDLVIAKPALREVLGPLGVRLLWPPDRLDLETMPAFVRALAAEIGLEQKADAVLKQYLEKVEFLRTRTASLSRVRVYFEGTGLGRTVGRKSVLHEMIELAGGENIAADIDRPSGVRTNEAILLANPEVIILSPFADPTEDILRRPGWETLSAVVHGRVHRIPLEERYVMLATPRCVEGCLEFLLPWFHPSARGLLGRR